ncbi:MAG: CRISPR-associated endonuclease Cas2 [Candidatus Sericytochromatia bacterium]
MPFVIITYDIEETRVNKIRKILKKYLYWSQNSVFEGEITDSLLEKCKIELKKTMKSDYDSIYFYEIANPNNIKKNVFGQEKNFDSNFI